MIAAEFAHYLTRMVMTDSEDDEAIIDWTALPRCHGDGRFIDDAVRLAHGRRVLLVADVWAALQARPDLVGDTLSFARFSERLM